MPKVQVEALDDAQVQAFLRLYRPVRGEAWDPSRANTYETRVKRTTPVGAFPVGDSPFGAADMSGSVFEWTSTLFGRGHIASDDPEFAHPCRPDDGREEAGAAANVRRVVRGGSWYYGHSSARAAFRDDFGPDNRSSDHGGYRLALTPA